MNVFWFLSHLSVLVNIVIYLAIFLVTLIPFLKIEVYEPSRCRPTAENVLERIKEKMWWSSMFSYKVGAKKDPQGLVIGKWFLALVTPEKVGNWRNQGIAYKVMIISLSSFAPEKPQRSKKEDGEEQETIEILTSPSAELHAKWQRHEVNYYGKVCPYQEAYVSQIVELGEHSFINGFPFGCVTLISGRAGSGKSFLAQILAKRLNGILCSSYSPTQYGHSIDEVYFTISPTKKKPLILLIDEIDIKISFPNEEKPCEWLTKDVKDKSSWSHFMDKVSSMDNLFVIMTTNVPFDDLDEIDRSYFREGRVHLRIEMEELISPRFSRQRFN